MSNVASQVVSGQSVRHRLRRRIDERWPHPFAPNATMVVSRDLMTRDHLVLGPPDQTSIRDPYAISEYEIEIRLPEGWKIAMSVGGTYECYDERGKLVELAVHRLHQIREGWFWACGARWLIYVAGPEPWYVSRSLPARRSE